MLFKTSNSINYVSQYTSINSECGRLSSSHQNYIALIKFFKEHGYRRSSSIFLAEAFAPLIYTYRLLLETLSHIPTAQDCYIALDGNKLYQDLLALGELSLNYDDLIWYLDLNCRENNIAINNDSLKNELSVEQIIRNMSYNLLAQAVTQKRSFIYFFNKDFLNKCLEFKEILSYKRICLLRGIKKHQAFFMEFPKPLIYYIHTKELKYALEPQFLLNFFSSTISNCIQKNVSKALVSSKSELDPLILFLHDYSLKFQPKNNVAFQQFTNYYYTSIQKLMLSYGASAAAIADFMSEDLLRTSNALFCKLLKFTDKKHTGAIIVQTFNAFIAELQKSCSSDDKGTPIILDYKKTNEIIHSLELHTEFVNKLPLLQSSVEMLSLIFNIVLPFISIAECLKPCIQHSKSQIVLTVRLYAYFAVYGSIHFILQGYNFEKFLHRTFSKKLLNEICGIASYVWLVLANYYAGSSKLSTLLRFINDNYKYPQTLDNSFLVLRGSTKKNQLLLPKKVFQIQVAGFDISNLLFSSLNFNFRNYITLVVGIINGTVTLRVANSKNSINTDFYYDLLANTDSWDNLNNALVSALNHPVQSMVRTLISSISSFDDHIEALGLHKIVSLKSKRIMNSLTILLKAQEFNNIRSVYKVHKNYHRSANEIAVELLFKDSLFFIEDNYFNEELCKASQKPASSFSSMSHITHDKSFSATKLTIAIATLELRLCRRFLGTISLKDFDIVKQILVDAISLSIKQEIFWYSNYHKMKPSSMHLTIKNIVENLVSEVLTKISDKRG